jgi:ribosomal protein S18 acetylase RimI-like enzyme
VAIPGDCVPPRGSYLLATVDGQPAGCVTLKPVDQNRCELKRLYVRPTFRGHNLGKQLVDAFTQTARTLGFQYAVLDSHKSMTAAHDIYKNSGFKVVKSPPDFPEALKQSVIFMRCVL